MSNEVNTNRPADVWKPSNSHMVGDQRVLPAADGQMYSTMVCRPGPAVGEVEVSRPRQALFVDCRGNLYDELYDPIAWPGSSSRTRVRSMESIGRSSITSTASLHALLDKNAPIFEQFPDPENYSSFYEYECALLGYKQEVQALLHDVELPVPITRSYCRPRMPKAADMISQRRHGSDVLAVQEAYVDSNRERSHTQSQRIWQCQLAPVEPQPEVYDTFEEYEAALKKWHKVVMESVDIIPPHPSQLEKLIGVHPVKVLNPVIAQQRWKEAGDMVRKGIRSSAADINEEMREKAWESLSDETKESIHRCVQKLIDQWRFGQRKPWDVSTLFCTIFWCAQCHQLQSIGPCRFCSTGVQVHHKSSRQSHELELDETSMKALASLQRDKSEGVPSPSPPPETKKDPLISSASSGVDPAVLIAARPQRPVDNKPLALRWNAELEIEGFRREDTKQCRAYAALLAREVARVDQLPGLQYLVKSGGDPIQTDSAAMAYQLFVREPSLATIISVLQDDNVKIPDFYEFLRLDSQQSQFSPESTEEGSLKPRDSLDGDTRDNADHHGETAHAPWVTSSALLKSIRLDNIGEILALVEDTLSDLVKSKLAMFMQYVFVSTEMAICIIENLVAQDDIDNLRNLVQAASFLECRTTGSRRHNDLCTDFSSSQPNLSRSTMSSAVWMWDLSVRKILYGLYGSGSYFLVSALFTHYFIDYMRDSLVRANNAFHTGVYEALVERGRSLSTTILEYLPFGHRVFQGISHRSRMVSSVCAFATKQLILSTETNPELNRVREDSLLLFRSIRSAQLSKMTHVREQVKTVFTTILDMGNPDWCDWLLDQYSIGGYLEKEFLGDNDRDSSQCEVTMPWLQVALRRGLKKSFTGLVGQKMFKSTLQTMMRHIHMRSVCLKTVYVTRLLSLATERLYELNLITITNTTLVKTAQRDEMSASEGDPASVTILYQDIMMLVTGVGLISDDHGDVKCNMVRTLRFLLKVNRAFDLVKKEESFYVCLLGLCRDSKHLALNREAWRLFFQLVKYHGAIEQMAEIRQLGPFLDLIGTNSSAVTISNGLYYLAKIFALVQTVEKTPKNSKKQPLDARETMQKMHEKNIKTVCDHIQKAHMFIKFHMIYRRYAQANAHGGPFQNLAKFYGTLLSSPMTTKLLKEVTKNPEYRAGLDHVKGLMSYDKCFFKIPIAPQPH